MLLDDAAAVAAAVAQAIVRVAGHSAVARGHFNLALAGGTTPRAAYELLASDPSVVRWDCTDVFFSDERCVPPDDPGSNQGMARAALLSRVPISEHRIHPIACGDAPAGAALQYESELRRHFATHQDSLTAPVFDLTLLGVGTDGHTASLFPGDRAVSERERWVLSVGAPAGIAPRDRITLTLPILNRSRHVLFIATGTEKRAIVRRLLSENASAESLPAALVRGLESTTWFLDHAAAGKD